MRGGDAVLEVQMRRCRLTPAASAPPLWVVSPGRRDTHLYYSYETPSLPPNQCRRGLHRYLSASRVSLAFFVLHSVIHWYLSAKGGLSSCPHSIVFIHPFSSSHQDSTGHRYSPSRGKENGTKKLSDMFASSPNACYLNPIADITLWICVPLTSNRQMKAKHVECWR